MRGHPAFKAMHTTAMCCRSCMEKWWKVPKGCELTADFRLNTAIYQLKPGSAAQNHPSQTPFFGRDRATLRSPWEKLYSPTLTLRPKIPEKLGVFSLLKKHEKNFQKPLASQTLFWYLIHPLRHLGRRPMRRDVRSLKNGSWKLKRIAT